MSLVRWEPFRELEEIFGHSMAPRTTGGGGKDPIMVFDWSPTADVAETPDERLEGERKQEEDESKKYHRIECFLRTLALPDNVDEASRASLAEPDGHGDARVRSLAHRAAVLC